MRLEDRKYGTVADQRRILKGEQFAGWSTSGEFAKVLGITTDHFKKYVQAGYIPSTEHRLANGWRVWPPEVVRAAVDRRMHRRGLGRGS